MNLKQKLDKEYNVLYKKYKDMIEELIEKRSINFSDKEYDLINDTLGYYSSTKGVKFFKYKGYEIYFKAVYIDSNRGILCISLLYIRKVEI